MLVSSICQLLQTGIVFLVDNEHDFIEDFR